MYENEKILRPEKFGPLEVVFMKGVAYGASYVRIHDMRYSKLGKIKARLTGYKPSFNETYDEAVSEHIEIPPKIEKNYKDNLFEIALSNLTQLKFKNKRDALLAIKEISKGIDVELEAGIETHIDNVRDDKPWIDGWNIDYKKGKIKYFGNKRESGY